MTILATAVLGYIAFVALMELAIGLIQPDMDIGVVLTTRDAKGNPSSRKLAGFAFEDRLYVSSNHWLRGWYHQALANPEVEVTVRGEQNKRIAVPIEGEERARVAEAYQFGLMLRFICGFAPNRFLRLDPVG